MLRFQGPKASAQLSGGGQRIHQHQATGHLHHGEPDRHCHVINALELLKAPHLARDQLFKMGGALAIGIQRQQRPPRPALIGFRYGTGLSHADTEIQQSFIPLKLPGMTRNSTIWVMLNTADMFRE